MADRFLNVVISLSLYLMIESRDLLTIRMRCPA